MLMRSISCTEAAPSENATARSRIFDERLTRWSWVRRFESSTPAMARVSGGMITAHATTGPAMGPRPTSSTPARSGPLSRRRSRSMVVHRLRRGTSRRRGFSLGVFGSGVDWRLPCSTSSVMRCYASPSEVWELRLDPGLGTGLRYGFLSRNHDLGFPLSDAGRLAGEVAEVVELGAPDASAADDRDARDHRALEREDSLDSDTVRDLADGEGGTDATTALGDANA